MYLPRIELQIVSGLGKGDADRVKQWQVYIQISHVYRPANCASTQVYRIKLVVILPVDLRSQADDLRHDRTEQPFRPMRIIQPLPFLLQMFNLPIDLLAALVALRFMQAVARNDILNSIILCIPTAPQGLPVPFPRSTV